MSIIPRPAFYTVALITSTLFGPLGCIEPNVEGDERISDAVTAIPNSNFRLFDPVLKKFSVRGGGGGTTHIFHCPKDKVMDGMNVWADQRVRGVGFYCYGLEPNGTIGFGNYQAWLSKRGGGSYPYRFGHDRGSYNYLGCPSGQMVTSMFGRSGAVVDQIGVGCSDIRGVVAGTQTSGDRSAGGSGGGAFRDRCGPNFVATGARVQTNGDSVTSIQLWCTEADDLNHPSDNWVVPNNKPTTVKTQSGWFLRAEHGGGSGKRLFADRRIASTDETFRLVDLGGGQVAFKTRNNRYLRALNGGGSQVKADASAIGPWERYRLVHLDGDRFGIMCSTGHYLRADGGGGNGQELRCDREWLLAHETFRIGLKTPETVDTEPDTERRLSRNELRREAATFNLPKVPIIRYTTQQVKNKCEQDFGVNGIRDIFSAVFTDVYFMVKEMHEYSHSDAPGPRFDSAFNYAFQGQNVSYRKKRFKKVIRCMQRNMYGQNQRDPVLIVRKCSAAVPPASSRPTLDPEGNIERVGELVMGTSFYGNSNLRNPVLADTPSVYGAAIHELSHALCGTEDKAHSSEIQNGPATSVYYVNDPRSRAYWETAFVNNTELTHVADAYRVFYEIYQNNDVINKGVDQQL